MKIKILIIGKIREKNWRELFQLYENRIRKYVKLEVTEITVPKYKSSMKIEEILKREANLIRKHLDLQKNWIVSLDKNGFLLDSEQFARWLENKMIQSTQNLVFIIGGPFGISQDILNISNEIISLSRLTFSHDLSRLILLEQLYRAFTIIKGEPYHK